MWRSIFRRYSRPFAEQLRRFGAMARAMDRALSLHQQESTKATTEEAKKSP
jgi:hypothetical protein